jgi:hypothetical protein
MGIRFLCPNGHKLNVKEFLAGKRGICPDCDAKFIVPAESGGQVEALTEMESPPPLTAQPATALADVASELATDVWHVRTGSGSQHGPATTSLIKSWIGEGKVDRDSWVWRTGWLDWQRASDVFPELGAVLGAPPLPKAANPFIDDSAVIRTDEYMTQGSDVISAHRRLQRERRERMKTVSLFLGGMIFLLTLVMLVVLMR